MLNAIPSGKTSRFKLIKLYDNITSQTLKDEISRRKLSYELVSEYLYQAFILDRKSQKKSIAFAFPNVKDHYEITIPYPIKCKSFKASITQNAFTHIGGEQSNSVEIFSSVWDFMTWLTMMKAKVNKYDAYILNGKHSVPQVIEAIRSRGDKIKSIMDFSENGNDGDTNRNILADLAEEVGILYGAQNYLFQSYSSLSDYWMSSNICEWPGLK